MPPSEEKRCRNHGLRCDEHCDEVERMLGEVPGDFLEGEGDSPVDAIVRLRLNWEERCIEREATINVIDAFASEVDAAIDERARPKGGQHVPFHGDFASVVPSALARLRWWAREMRKTMGAT